MKRPVMLLTLALLGTMAIRIVITGEYLRFVKSSLAPWLLIVGVALIVLSLAGDKAGSTAGESMSSHGHSHAMPRVGWLLLLPVAIVYTLSPPALGSYTAGRTPAREPARLEASGATATAPASSPSTHNAADPSFVDSPEVRAAEAASLGIDVVPLPDAGDDGYRETTLSEYTSRIYWQTKPTYEGEKVRLTGFVTPRRAGGWFLTRVQIACCAADGFPVKVFVRDQGKAPAADTWVEVEGVGVGTVGEEVFAEGAHGEIEPVRITPVPEPASPYE